MAMHLCVLATDIKKTIKYSDFLTSSVFLTSKSAKQNEKSTNFKVRYPEDGVTHFFSSLQWG